MRKNLRDRLPRLGLNSRHINKQDRKAYSLNVTPAAALIIILLCLVQNLQAECTSLGRAIKIQATSAIDIKTDQGHSSTFREYIKFNGEILSDTDKQAVEYVKVIFFTQKEIFSTYTSANGSFSLKIPKKLIGDKNIVRLSYNEIHKVHTENYIEGCYMRGTQDYVLSKEDVQSPFKISANISTYKFLIPFNNYCNETAALISCDAYTHAYLSPYMTPKQFARMTHPRVLYNEQEVSISDFKLAVNCSGSKLNLQDKDCYYLPPELAVLLYGENTNNGLWILKDKE